MRIAIRQAKQIREELNLTHLVIFGIDNEGMQHVCTHGGNLKEAKEAADFGNNLKRSLAWPERLCNEKPLVRICENCALWRRFQFDPNSLTPGPYPGLCFFEPTKVQRDSNDIACNHLEPKI
jgi:hypothetical protein